MAKRLKVVALCRLHPSSFLKIAHFFMLFADDLFILELQKLPLFLKVGNDLTETFLEEVDLGLEKFDFLVFFKLLLGLLLDSLAFGLEVSLDLLILELDLGVFVL